MAGLTAGAPTPTALTVHGQSRVLEVAFSDGAVFRLPFELMRVYSPSAEVQGHGPGQETLQTGKREVGLLGLEGDEQADPSVHGGLSKAVYAYPQEHYEFWRTVRGQGPSPRGATAS